LATVLDHLSVRLDEASRESARLDTLRRDFVANISHELRTPVTVLRGSLESLCDEVVTEPELVKSYYRQMLNESLHLQRLVNDLLDLSRLQNVDFKFDLREINLSDVLDDVVRSARQMAQAKNIRIELHQDSQLFSVVGDYGRLRQMLLIVLDNAIKFSGRDSTVDVKRIGKEVTLTDYGIGIPAQDLPYIFDRFYKTKSEQNKNGTGLGLAIAKQIADRQGVNISVVSKQNEKTEFVFRF
jgi:signal transduction histidine kinase